MKKNLRSLIWIQSNSPFDYTINDYALILRIKLRIILSPLFILINIDKSKLNQINKSKLENARENDLQSNVNPNHFVSKSYAPFRTSEMQCRIRNGVDFNDISKI